MTKRAIIKIDEKKCTGCGLCVPNCAEGALQIVDGKARLISDLFCDGLGACLGHCPESAIEVIEREAEPYNEVRVMEENIVPAGENTIKAHIKHLKDHGATEFFNQAVDYLKSKNIPVPDLEEKKCGCSSHESPKKEGHSGGCPGSKMMQFDRTPKISAPSGKIESELNQWPVQIHLVSPYAPYFKNADIVVLADCVAYAYAETHREFIKNHAVLIGCPKLDDSAAYINKIAEIIKNGNPKSIKVVRMEVPCCGGMIEIVKQAIMKSGILMPFETVTISLDGRKL